VVEVFSSGPCHHLSYVNISLEHHNTSSYVCTTFSFHFIVDLDVIEVL
jgi:hypothetical protein